MHEAGEAEESFADLQKEVEEDDDDSDSLDEDQGLAADLGLSDREIALTVSGEKEDDEELDPDDIHIEEDTGDDEDVNDTKNGMPQSNHT